MKKALNSFLIATIIMSCSSSNDDTVSSEIINSTLPSKIVEENSKITSFTYKNTNEIAEIVTLEGKEIYAYDAENITKIEYYKNNKLVQTKEYKYANNKVSTETITNEGASKIIYLYDWITENHLKYTKINVQNPVSEIGECFYTNGNLTKTLHSFKDEDVTSTFENNYEYDTQLNPFVNIKSLNKISHMNPNFGKNNIVKTSSTTTLKSSTSTSTFTNTTSASYNYNSKNFPDKQTTKELNNYGQTITNTKEYFYNH